MKKETIIFYGSTNFSQIILQTLIENFDVKLVITQPDKPVGRKRIMTESPVKTLAKENDIEVLTPVKLNKEFIEQINKVQVDLGVVAAYGKIISKTILDHPKHGCINVHGSLLPAYRGATPVQSAIRDGLKTTGVTIIQMDEGMDTGGIYTKSECEILNTDNVDSLMEKLAHLGAKEVKEFVPKIVNEQVKPEPQNDEATFCYVKDFSFENGEIVWREVDKVYNHIRAFSPQPRAWTWFKGQKLFILESQIFDEQINEFDQAGEMFAKDGKLLIGCKEGNLEVKKLQLEGKNVIDGKTFINGYQKDLPIKLIRI